MAEFHDIRGKESHEADRPSAILFHEWREYEAISRLNAHPKRRVIVF